MKRQLLFVERHSLYNLFVPCLMFIITSVPLKDC